MVLDKGQHTRRIGIEVVIDKRVVDAVQSLAVVIGILVGSLHGVKKTGNFKENSKLKKE